MGIVAELKQFDKEGRVDHLEGVTPRGSKCLERRLRIAVECRAEPLGDLGQGARGKLNDEIDVLCDHRFFRPMIHRHIAEGTPGDVGLF